VTGLTFFVCRLSFSLVKASMNAPRLCKLRQDCLAGNGATIFVTAFPIVNEFNGALLTKAPFLPLPVKHAFIACLYNL
jgi:hypothetical protein